MALIWNGSVKVSGITIGVALVLSVAAFVLALWPAVSDAPWEQKSVIMQQSQPAVAEEYSQQRICLHLIDAITKASDSGATVLFDGGGPSTQRKTVDSPWELAGCSDYFAEFAK